MNTKFQNAINKKTQSVPPIWFMRQAGRYHSHYQALRAKHTFDQLCRVPELAAQVALGPIQDFDFDVSILFSDLLYPLDALGMKLSYSDKGPHFEESLSKGYKLSHFNLEESLSELKFQSEALTLTRKALPQDKSLIGFVGGVWTLFVYATEGGHAGSLTQSKRHWFLQQEFISALTQLIEANIEKQLQAGAEVVMIFDTSMGEVSPLFFQKYLAQTLIKWAHKFPKRLGYYSKGTQPVFFNAEFLNAPWAGRGVDHRCLLAQELANHQANQAGFLQGNFDQALLFQETADFKESVAQYISSVKSITLEQRAGWVSGLGHGVLPQTPEKHVKLFIETLRNEMSKV